MKLVVNLKLTPTPGQAKLLRETLRQANAACNYLSEVGWKAKILRQYDLHKLAYHDTKQRFGLVADLVIRCIAKVADAYKADKRSMRRFRPDAAQPYNHHILRFLKEDAVSIWLLGGRQKIPFVMGERQHTLFAHRKGEVDLMRVRGKWYLAIVCDIDDPKLIETTDILGVDLGIVNIAADSTGKVYSGKTINRVRCTYAHRRRNLQRKQTRSATRKLVKISGRQARFQKDVNHCISKTIVSDAQRTASAIALEDLGGIRERVTARRHQRARLSNWAFAQLRTFLGYKAAMHGIPMILVDPRNTSRECPSCGHTDAKNRRTRNEFVCARCGLAGPADTIAARNIRARAVVNQPMVTGERAA